MIQETSVYCTQRFNFTWRKTGAPGRELEEVLPLLRGETDENVDELEERRARAVVAQLGLGVADDVLTAEHRALVATQHGADLQGTERAQLVQGEDLKRSQQK